MIEPPVTPPDNRLTRSILDFWHRNVNAERLMGRSISQHPRGSRGYFEDLANQRYRSHRHLLPWIANLKPHHSVLEVGCGVGLDTYQMAQQGLEVTAVDLTYPGVSTAKHRFTEESLPGSFSVADACQLPFSSCCFDYVYSFGVLHHVADTQVSLHEVYRVLKPGGEALIMLYNRHSLNEWVHRLVGIPFEDKDELCPVVRRYYPHEIHSLFSNFSRVDLHIDHLFGEGYGRLYRWTPYRLAKWLARYWGWHLMIHAWK